MVKVDEKGRIVLSQEVRERLGLTPGTEVEVYAADGKAVVEPETDPQEIIDRMETLTEVAATDRNPDPYDELNAEAKSHANTIRRQAEKSQGDSRN